MLNFCNIFSDHSPLPVNREVLFFTLYLTNKEASTVFCFVKAGTQEAIFRAREKCRGNMRRSRVFFLTSEVLCRFLNALQQNRAQSRLLYLFHNKVGKKVKSA